MTIEQVGQIADSPLAFLRQLVDNPKKTALLLAVGAFIVRLTFVLTLDADKFLFPDTAIYDGAAKALIDKWHFPSDYSRAPGYPIYVAILYGLFGRSFLVARLGDALLGAINCVLVYWIGLKVFGKRTGLLAAAYTSVYSYHVFLAGLVYPTVLYTTLVLVVTYASLVICNRPRILEAVILGLLMGLAQNVREMFITSMPFILGWLFLRWRVPLWRRTALIVVSLLIFVLTLMPWAVRNNHVLGAATFVRANWSKWLPNFELAKKSPAGVDVWHFVGEHEMEGSLDRRGMTLRKAVWHYLENPIETLRHLTHEFIAFWNPIPARFTVNNPNFVKAYEQRDGRFQAPTKFLRPWTVLVSILTYGPLLLGTLLALAWYRNWPSGAWLLFAIIVSFGLGHAFFYAEIRYRLPIDPLMIIFTSFVVGRLLRLVK